jgi:hypothetical protein
MNHKPFPLTLAVALTVVALAAFLWLPGRAAGPDPSGFPKPEGSTTAPAAEPSPRIGHTLTRVGDDLYLFGGLVETAAATASHGPRAPLSLPANDLWRWGNVNDWEEKPPTNTPPPARFYHGAAAANGKLYVFFGVDASYSTLSDIWAYNLLTDEWAQQPSVAPPPPRSQFSAVAIGRDIYVWGGLGADFQVITDPFAWRYDPATGNWTPMAGLPPRFGHVAGVVNGKMVVSGGSDSAQYYADAQAFDPVANQWAQVSLSGAALESLAYSAAAASGNIMQIFGGQHREFSAAALARPATEDATARDTVWELTFDAEVTTATVRQLAPLPARRKYAAAAMLPTAGAQAAAGPAATGYPQALLFGGAVDYRYVAATLLYSAGLYTWAGGADSDWRTTANWTPAGVPIYGNDVSVPAGAPRWPLVAAAAACHDLTIASGAALTVSQGVTLTATGVVTNSGRLMQVRAADAAGVGVAFGLWGNGSALTYAGVTITPTVAALGTVTVTVRGAVCGADGALPQTVKRCFEIAPQTPGPATVRFY